MSFPGITSCCALYFLPFFYVANSRDYLNILLYSLFFYPFTMRQFKKKIPSAESRYRNCSTVRQDLGGIFFLHLTEMVEVCHKHIFHLTEIVEVCHKQTFIDPKYIWKKDLFHIFKWFLKFSIHEYKIYLWMTKFKYWDYFMEVPKKLHNIMHVA